MLAFIEPLKKICTQWVYESVVLFAFTLSLKCPLSIIPENSSSISCVLAIEYSNTGSTSFLSEFPSRSLNFFINYVLSMSQITFPR